MTIDVEKLTRVYTRIRDKRAEISAKFKEEDPIVSRIIAAKKRRT